MSQPPAKKPTNQLPANIPNTPEVQKIMQRFLTDADFRADVLDDPADALTEAGFDAPPELIEHFENLDPDTVEQQIAQGSDDDDGGTC